MTATAVTVHATDLRAGDTVWLDGARRVLESVGFTAMGVLATYSGDTRPHSVPVSGLVTRYV